MKDKRFAKYKGKKIMITGGLGFIGSALAIKLVENGADVLIVDSMIPEYGGNLFNIDPVKNKVKINFCDITDKNAMEWLVVGQDYIFHLAGQVSHVMSFSDPYKDIDYNITGTVILAEACRKFNPKVKIVHTGTRGQYGPATILPMNEEAYTNPKGIYEISNLTAESILRVYNDSHGVKSVLTRLTNIYGPRAQMKSNKYCVVNWFVRLAVENKPITIHGEGTIKRDFLYIDDAVDALLLLPLSEKCFGQIFNVGHNEVSNFRIVADLSIKHAKTGSLLFVPTPEERKKQEPGDFYSDISKIKKYIGWKPKVLLDEGIKRTVDYYKKYGSKYW